MVNNKIIMIIIILQQNTAVIKETKHKCTPDIAKNEVDIKLDNLKKSVVNSNFEPVPTMFNETIASINDTGIPLLTKVPTFKSVKSSLYYNRNKKENIKKNKI